MNEKFKVHLVLAISLLFCSACFITDFYMFSDNDIVLLILFVGFLGWGVFEFLYSLYLKKQQKRNEQTNNIIGKLK